MRELKVPFPGSMDEMKDLARRNGLPLDQPIIFRNTALNAAPFTVQGMIERFGNQPVNVVVDWNNSKHQKDPDSQEMVTAKMEEFLKTVAPETSGSYFVASGAINSRSNRFPNKSLENNGLVRDNPDLFRSLNIPTVDEKSLTVVLFAGNGTMTRFHNHGQVFHFVTQGRKQFYLIDPRFEDCITEDQGHDQFVKYSPLVIDSKDDSILPSTVESLPRINQVPVIKATVNAGDVLYWPDGWYHQVDSVEGQVSTSVAYISASKYARKISTKTPVLSKL